MSHQKIAKDNEEVENTLKGRLESNKEAKWKLVDDVVKVRIQFNIRPA